MQLSTGLMDIDTHVPVAACETRLFVNKPVAGLADLVGIPVDPIQSEVAL